MCKDTIPVVFGIKEMHIDFCNALAWDAKEMKKQEGVMSTNLKQYSLINKSIPKIESSQLQFASFATCLIFGDPPPPPPPPPPPLFLFFFF